MVKLVDTGNADPLSPTKNQIVAVMGPFFAPGHAPVHLLGHFDRKWKESVTFLFDYAVALARTFFDAGAVEHRISPSL